MITCVKCQRQNEDHYKFCLGCGSPLTAQAPAPSASAGEETTCPQCASRIAAGQRFCSSCGARAPSDSDAPTTQPEAGGEPSATVVVPDQDPAPAAAPEPVAPAPEPAPEPEPEPAPEPEPEAQAPPVLARLILIKRDGSQGETLDLIEGDNIVGRNTPLQAFSEDEHLSPIHAIFRLQSSDGTRHIEILDQDSLNGVYYRSTGPVELSDGDIARIGQGVFRYEALESLPPSGEPQHGTNPESIWGRLARISGPNNAASNAYLLWKESHSIGREQGDFTFPDDGYVSGTHARIYRHEGKAYLEDLRSSNGTYIRIRGSHTITDGALLLIGKQPYRFQLS